MMIIRKIFLFAFLLGVTFFASAQQAESLLQEANTAYADLEYFSATKLYERYHAIDSTNVDIIYKLADCYWKMREYDNAKFWYSKISIDSILLNHALIRRLAELSAMNGDYKEAAKLFSHLKDFHSREQGFIQRDRFLSDSADWTIHYLNINTEQYREFSPMLLGSSIIWSTNEPKRSNSQDINGWDANGFVRQKFLPKWNDLASKDFPGSKMTNGKAKDQKNRNVSRTFSAADVAIRSRTQISTGFSGSTKNENNLAQDLQIFKKLQYNVGHATASYAASKIYLTVNRQEKISRNAIRSLGIVEADILNNRVANPSFVPIHSTDPADSNEIILHGAIDPMGKHLVFSSDRKGGKGGFDLYTSIRSLDGKWSTPEPIVSLNTVGDEVFPAFSANGDFYFSSNGRAGLGGLDLYKVKVTVAPYIMALIFENPEHLSYPINSDHDDFGLVLSPDTLKGYFTSDRYGTDDLFSFDFNLKYVLLHGSVIDSTSNTKVQGVMVSLFEEVENGKLTFIDSAFTDKNGSYTFSKARPNRAYVIKVYESTKLEGAQDMVIIKASTEKAGIEKELDIAFIGNTKLTKAGSSVALNDSTIEAQKTKNTTQSGIVKDVFPVAGNQLPDPFVGSPTIPGIINIYDNELPSDTFFAVVYFGFDLHALSSKARKTIDEIVNYMRSHPHDEFVLLGHSDVVGDPQYNIDLSKRRVVEVARYIVSKGIDEKLLRLSYYGEQRPAKTNTISKKFQRLNRRVEFLLIKKN